MRHRLVPAVLALCVLGGCGDRDWRDRKQVRERPGDAALIGSAPFGRELLRRVSQGASTFEAWSSSSPTPTEITDRFLSHDTALFCTFDAATKRGHQIYETVGLLPPNTAEGWAALALENAALADSCGLRLFVQARGGRPGFIAVYNILKPGSAVRRRTLSGPEARLVVVMAPKGPAAAFPALAARLAGAPVVEGGRPDLESLWTIDGDPATVRSEAHRRALLQALSSRLAVTSLPEGKTTEVPLDAGLAPLCAMPAAEKARFRLSESVRMSREAIERMNRALSAACHLRIFGQSGGGLTRMVAVYDIEGFGGVAPPVRLRGGPVSLDVLIREPGQLSGPPKPR
jgi:hypothetical protein